MPKFYIKWQLNPLTTPSNPEERVKAWLSSLQMIKDGLKAGTIKEWGMCSDASGGYAFSDLNEVDLYIQLLKYMPNTIFDIKPVLTVDQVIDSIKKATAAAKGK